MFQSARIKLTSWYLFIIMLISMSFSAIIFTTTTKELTRGFRRAEMRFKAENLGIPVPRQLPKRLEKLGPQLVEDLKAAKRRVIMNLLMVNGVILVFSAAAGYFLAGETLKPIEKAMEEQKRFVADASHELRTPLTALKTSIEVALRDKKMSTKEARRIIQSNLKDVNDLQSLANSLLSLARFQNNGNNFVFKETSIANIVKKAYKKILPLAKKKGVNIKLKLQNYFPRVNKANLKEMVTVFLDNGVKYTPKGGKVTAITKKDRKYAILQIKDTGIGIEKKDIPYIFDRFYRVDASRSKTKTDGFGLGLSVAKKIIEQHKGSVNVKSKIGKGTTFTIKLPLS